MSAAPQSRPALTLVSHHLCPYVQRAAIGLAEKGVAFERRTIDLDAKPDWFLALSPLGKVPLLIVRGPPNAVIFESAVICEYIEDTQPEPRLHPEDPLDRARHRSWIEFGSGILADIWRLEIARGAEAYRAAERALGDKLGRVEAELGGGPFFSGDRFSLVDAVFGPVFRYFDVLGPVVDGRLLAARPKLRRWREALSGRPSIRDAVGPDYAERLRAFLVARDAHVLTLSA